MQHLINNQVTFSMLFVNEFDALLVFKCPMTAIKQLAWKLAVLEDFGIWAQKYVKSTSLHNMSRFLDFEPWYLFDILAIISPGCTMKIYKET